MSKPSAAVAPGVDSDVLTVLAGSTNPRTGRAIAKLAGRSPTGVQAVLDRLVDHGLVKREAAGKSALYTLNREHILFPIVELMAAARTTLFDRLRSTLESWEKRALHASVFGSTARGDGDTESDIDLLIVRPTNLDPEDPVWRSQLEDLADAVRSWTGNHAAVSEVAEGEFSRLVDEKSPVIKDVKGDAVHLTGPNVRKLLAGR